jgi:hypothetical protein
MRRVAFIMMITLSGVTAFGQGLLDCIEPDVLRALLLQGQGERPPVITGAVPAELAALKMPGQFTWIGSAERITGRVDASTNASQVSAAWRSTLAPAAARAAVASALTASGWEVQQRPGLGMNVFTSDSMPDTQTACRESRPVNVASNVMDGVTYTLVTIQRGSNTEMTCTLLSRFSAAPNSGFEPYLPQLAMPVDPATGATVRLGSGSMSTGPGAPAVTVRAEFTVKDSAGNVARHFAKQMTEQGWSSDANWSGAATAGSSWSKRVADGSLIQGTLLLTAFDERQFMAVLRLRRQQ